MKSKKFVLFVSLFEQRDLCTLIRRREEFSREVDYVGERCEVYFTALEGVFGMKISLQVKGLILEKRVVFLF